MPVLRSRNACTPLLIASWWEPENAVNTSFPAYGWRISMSILQHLSYTSIISLISSMFNFGSIPCENILYATFSTSILPVRSPFPNKVPSTRSAPASRLSSVAAIPVPLSLWGWTLNIIESLFLKCLCIHSIWSAYTFGVFISTVAGRLKMILFSGVGCQISWTAVQISSANSTSVPVKLSGEYSSWIFPSNLAARSFTIFVPSMAICLIASLSLWNTTSRWSTEVEL